MSDTGIFIFGFAVLGVTLAATMILTIGTSESDERMRHDQQQQRSVEVKTIRPNHPHQALSGRDLGQGDLTPDDRHRAWPRIAHS